MTIQTKMKTTRTEKFTLIAESRNYSMNEISNIWTNTERACFGGIEDTEECAYLGYPGYQEK